MRFSFVDTSSVRIDACKCADPCVSLFCIRVSFSLAPPLPLQAIPPVDGDIAALTNPLHLHQLLTARQMEHISHLQTRMKDESHQLRTTYVDDFHQTLDTFQHHTLDTFRCEFEKRDKLVATWAHEFRDRLQSQKDEECNAMRQTYETRIHLLQDRINATTRNDDTRLHIAEETSTKLAERLTESNQLNHNLRMELDEANASVVASSKRLVESESTIRELQLLVSSQESLLSSQSNSLASTSLALESSESKVQKLRSRMAEMESSIDREMTHTITTLEHELQRLRDELIDRDAKESTQVTSLKQAVRDLERALQERAHEMELAVSKMAIAEKERATLQHLVRQQEEMLAQVQQHMTNRSDANANTATPTSITPQRYSLGPHSRQSLSLSSSKADATVGDVDDSNRISAAKRKSSSPTNTLLLTQPSSTLYPPLSSSRISAQFSPASRSCLFDNEIEPDEEEEEDEYQQFFQRARDEEAVEQQGTDNENESTTKRTSISPKTLSRSTSSSTRTSLAHDATQVAPSRSSNSFTRKRRSTLSIPDPSSPSPALAHSYASDGQVNSHQTAPSSASSSRSSKRQSTKTPESHRSSLHSLHRVVSSSSPTTH